MDKDQGLNVDGFEYDKSRQDEVVNHKFVDVVRSKSHEDELRFFDIDLDSSNDNLTGSRLSIMTKRVGDRWEYSPMIYAREDFGDYEFWAMNQDQADEVRRQMVELGYKISDTRMGNDDALILEKEGKEGEIGVSFEVGEQTKIAPLVGKHVVKNDPESRSGLLDEHFTMDETMSEKLRDFLDIFSDYCTVVTRVKYGEEFGAVDFKISDEGLRSMRITDSKGFSEKLNQRHWKEKIEYQPGNGMSERFIKRYRELGLDKIFPWHEKYDRGGMAVGLYRSGDRMCNRQEALMQNPEINEVDGYLVMVGTGAGLGLLEWWPDDEMPEGILGVDVDPSQYVGGKMLELFAKMGFSWEIVERVIFKYGEHQGKDLTAWAIESVSLDDPQVREKMIDQIHSAQFRKDVEDMRTHSDYTDTVLKDERQGYFRSNPRAILKKRWGQIIELAQEGKFSYVYGSITEPVLLGLIHNNLEEFKQRKNLIYTSNVGDYADGLMMKNVKSVLDPNDNSLFAYTLRYEYMYRLRVSESGPESSWVENDDVD